MLISLSNLSNLLQIANFLFIAYFGDHFCYRSNDKSQINTKSLHLGYCSNKLMRKK